MSRDLLVNPELLPITPGIMADPVVVNRDVDFNITKPTLDIPVPDWNKPVTKIEPPEPVLDIDLTEKPSGNNRYPSDLIPEKKPLYPYPVFQQEEKKTKSNKLLLVAGVALLLLSLK